MVVLGAAFLTGWLVRAQLDIGLSVDSIRGFVSDLGWWAPVIFTALVTFRQFLLLPSALLLTAGGVAFGAACADQLQERENHVSLAQRSGRRDGRASAGHKKTGGQEPARAAMRQAGASTTYKKESQ